jgi:hypothetical protein
VILHELTANGAGSQESCRHATGSRKIRIILTAVLRSSAEQLRMPRRARWAGSKPDGSQPSKTFALSMNCWGHRIDRVRAPRATDEILDMDSSVSPTRGE